MIWWTKLFGHNSPPPLALPAPAPPIEVEALEKARAATSMPSPAEVAKAWMIDPMAAMGQSTMGYLQPPVASAIGFPMLRKMARIPPIAAIIGTRLNQIAEFSVPQSDDCEPGFRVELREKRKHPSPAERKAIEETQRMIEHCGTFTRPQDLFDRPGFEAYLRAFFRDSLELDHAATEVLFDRRGRPAGFQAVDSATIRRIAPNSRRPQSLAGEGDARFVQVINNAIVAEWRPGELFLATRRPRTDLDSYGYGFPELEEVARLVTAWLNGFDFNMNVFKNGALVPGFFAFTGMPEPQFEAFKRTWKQMVSGVSNAHSTPMVNMPDKEAEAKWTSLGRPSNADMQFFEWLGWIYRLVCADFQIDAVETGMQFGNEGQKSTLSQGGPGERIKSSQRRGLHPHLRFARENINRYLIWPQYPELQLTFSGLDEDAAKERAEQDGKRVKSIATLNEIRAEHDQPALPWGDVILDTVALQAKQSYEAAQEAKEQREQGGDQDQQSDDYEGDGDDRPEEDDFEEAPDDAGRAVAPVTKQRAQRQQRRSETAPEPLRRALPATSGRGRLIDLTL